MLAGSVPLHCGKLSPKPTASHHLRLVDPFILFDVLDDLFCFPLFTFHSHKLPFPSASGFLGRVSVRNVKLEVESKEKITFFWQLSVSSGCVRLTDSAP
ncbi:STYKc [Musa troglodytarum]|uniref:STYKc n=1 Tax=Musa troglodytarum TaxID=320322 RepID=A0A9E7HXE3_9LILI|nr:STYKc [Musa troglodytarum]